MVRPKHGFFVNDSSKEVELIEPAMRAGRSKQKISIRDFELVENRLKGSSVLSECTIRFGEDLLSEETEFPYCIGWRGAIIHDTFERPFDCYVNRVLTKENGNYEVVLYSG